MDYQIQDKLDFSDNKELGTDAVFTISSAKPGNGVEQLRDNNLDTYWQSDGSFPHYINIQFCKKVSVTNVCLYLDYTLDESYTAKKVVVSSGTSSHDLFDVVTIELTDPVGWVVIPLSNPLLSLQEEESTYLRTHMLQVKVLSMHQNGKDTHIRQVKILGPRESQRVMADFLYNDFKTVEMQQFAVLR